MDYKYVYYYEDRFSQEEVDERKLYLNTAVDNSAIDSIVYHIMRYNRLDKGIPKEERKPITLYINSPGGFVSDAYGVIDAIITSTTPVYTVNQALCASMAFLIFIVGDKRFSMPHAEFLMHDGSSGFGFESLAKLKDRIEFETIQLEKITKDLVLEHTKINSELYDQKYRIEWYMLPNEAKEHGIVDFIIGKDCSLDEFV